MVRFVVLLVLTNNIIFTATIILHTMQFTSLKFYYLFLL